LADDPGRDGPKRGLARGSHRHCRPSGPAVAPARGAVRRPAAARGGRPPACGPARHRGPRRAGRPPRPPQRRRGAAVPTQRPGGAAPDHRHGHPRPGRGQLRRHRGLPRRRAPGRVTQPANRPRCLRLPQDRGGLTTMWIFTARNVWVHKRRLAATVLAVAIGVAFLAGTLLLSDTLRANFNKLFTQANGSTDVVIRGATKISGNSGISQRTGIDATLLPQIRAVAGVADAQPYTEGYGQLVGRNGKAIGGGGPPTRAANWISDRELNPYRLVSGRAPVADDEAVINRGAAKSGHLSLGDTTILLTPRPVRV